MFDLKRSLAVGVLSLALGATSMVPAGAVTFPKVPVPSMSDVEQVQYRDRHQGDRAFERNWRRDNRERFAERKWRGHRGYRHHRPGYRRHADGWWYPFAAFGMGTIIGGAIANQPAARGNAHVDWCANRYRSYRAYDNTFQPYNGPRQRCVSPYGR